MPNEKIKIPPFLAKLSQEQKKELTPKWDVWRSNSDFGEPLVQWLKDQLEEAIEADEKIIAQSPIQMTSELLENKGVRKTLRKIIKVMEK
jgi:hypothetical protein